MKQLKKLLAVCLLALAPAALMAAAVQQVSVTGGPAPGQLAQFITPTQLGPSNLSIDANNNLVLKMVENPPGAPSVALAGAGAGNCTNGAHLFAVTFTTASGNSLAGATATVTVANNAANGQITVSSIPLGTDPFVTGRKVWMSQAGGTTLFLLSNGTIADNTTTSVTANDSDATLGAATLAPTSPTAIDTRLTFGNDGTTALPGGTDKVQVALVTLTTAQILALNTTPITVIAAPGAGKIITVDSIVAKLVFNSVAYTGANALTFRYTNGSGAQVSTSMASAFLDSASGTNYDWAPGASAETTPVANAPIVAFVGTANPAAGNSAINLTIRYHIITP